MSLQATSMWYIENGASFHMMGVKEYFISLNEEEIEFYMKLRENGKYKETRVSIVKF